MIAAFGRSGEGITSTQREQVRRDEVSFVVATGTFVNRVQLTSAPEVLVTIRRTHSLARRASTDQAALASIQ